MTESQLQKARAKRDELRQTLMQVPEFREWLAIQETILELERMEK